MGNYETTACTLLPLRRRDYICIRLLLVFFAFLTQCSVARVVGLVVDAGPPIDSQDGSSRASGLFCGVGTLSQAVARSNMAAAWQRAATARTSALTGVGE